MNLEQKISQVLALAKQDINSNFNYVNDVLISESDCNFDSFYIQDKLEGWSYNSSVYVGLQGSNDNFTHYPIESESIQSFDISNIKSIFCVRNSRDFFVLKTHILNVGTRRIGFTNRYYRQTNGSYTEDNTNFYTLEPNIVYYNDSGSFRQGIYEYNGLEPSINSLTLDFKNNLIGSNLSLGIKCFFVLYDSNGVYGLTNNELSSILEYDTPLELKEGNIELYRKFNKYCFNYFEEDERPEDFNDKIGTNYYYTNIVHTCDSFGDNDTIINQSSGRFEIPKGSKIWGVVNNNYPYNVSLYTDTNAIKYYANRYTDDFEYITELPTLNITYTDTITDGNGNFAYGILTTNIPIWGNNTDANRYKNGQIDSSESLNSGGGFVPPRINRTGTSINKANELDSYESGIFITNSGGYSSTHLLTSSQLSSVFNLIYDEETNPWEQIKQGLKFYGENPIESIIDLYYSPIDLSQFCATTSSGTIMFGGYQLEIATHPEIISSGKMLTIANTMLVGTYQDYRDYTNIRIYCYLPFCGIKELSNGAYMDKLFTIKCTFDVKSHNMKYWLFADNYLVETVECSLGITFPIIASDFVGKAQQNIQAITSIVSSVGSVASGVVGGVSEISKASSMGVGLSTGEDAIFSAIGGLKGAIESGGLPKIDEGFRDLLSRTPKTISGNQSNATACYDIKYPFLIFETVESIEPLNLKETYGKPCNIITKLSECNGFTMCDSIRLKTSANLTEKQMIVSQLSNGVII